MSVPPKKEADAEANGLASSMTTAQGQEGAAPLRLALLLQPAGSDLPAALEGERVIELILSEADDNLAQPLSRATECAGEDGLVRLRGPRQSLLLMPALKAAKAKLHPHAILAGLHLSSTQEGALAGALQQAKRFENHLGVIRHQTEDDPLAVFDSLCRLISDIAQRTITRIDTSAATPTATPTATEATTKRHYWFTEPYQGRVAAMTLSAGESQAGAATSQLALILTQGTGRLKARSLLSAHQLFFLIPGSSEAALNQGLWALAAALDRHGKDDQQASQPHDQEIALIEMMQANLEAFATAAPTRFVISLQATSIDALKQEISAMSEALTSVCKEKGEYRTPSGSYFSAAPLGQAKLAFVYPGVGTIYPDMLSELHSYFPALFTRLQQQGDLKAMLQADLVYGGDDSICQQMPLSNMAIAGVGASYLLTKLLMDEFAVQPQFALGYSMGEAAMWASLDVWQAPHQLIDKTLKDPLFTQEISGPLEAVRQAWQLSDNESIEWNSFLVRCPAEQISALLERYPRVYLAITQGDTCVIAGCQHSCEALLKELNKRGIPANRVTAMHTPPAEPLAPKVAAFYRQALLPGAANHEIKFISAANLARPQEQEHDQALNQHKPLSSESIAESIAQTFCHRLDFGALIQSASRQGAALFVEVGADRQNCTLIDKILKGSHAPHVSVPVNAKGTSDITTLLKALGQLISHRVPVSLTVLQLGLKRQLDLLLQTKAQQANTQAKTHGDTPHAAPPFQEDA
ncbi:PfaB family protein [Shewanella insulae]|uniref:PfaB family protein n=1 Tax=Shewanella insulae TaxID=2681496 RepID=UPI002480A6B8|nr:PfaB family protein [Shewanella insulae]